MKKRIISCVAVILCASMFAESLPVRSATIKPVLKINKSAITINKGKTAKVDYKAAGKIKAYSDKKKVAAVTVSKKYLKIKAKNEGKAKIVVKCGKKRKTINVTVTIKEKVYYGSFATNPPETVRDAAKNVNVYANPVNSFSLDMFAEQSMKDEMNGSNSNTFVSPMSMYVALMILNSGAAGNTKSQINNALGIDNFDEFSRNFSSYIKGSQDEKVTFNMSNSLWFGKSKALSNTLDRDYISPVQQMWNVDVAKNVVFDDNTVKNINQWCDKRTNGMIKQIADKGTFNRDTVLAILNAILFQGRWRDKFYETATMQEPFKGKNGETVVSMMTQSKRSYRYFDNNKIKGIRLPYGNGCYAMEIFMPSDNNAFIGDVWKQMSNEEKLNVLNGFGQAEDYSNIKNINILKLPKFRVDKGMDNPVEFLKKKGVIDAFNSDYANFTKMGKDIFVGGIIHKASIEVDEEGSKAAAVTMIKGKTTSALMKDEPEYNIDFIVDRPFIFCIRDIYSGMILFIGQINDLK